MTIDELLADATRRMDRAIEATRDHLNSVRTGRASAIGGGSLERQALSSSSAPLSPATPAVSAETPEAA